MVLLKGGIATRCEIDDDNRPESAKANENIDDMPVAEISHDYESLICWQFFLVERGNCERFNFQKIRTESGGRT